MGWVKTLGAGLHDPRHDQAKNVGASVRTNDFLEFCEVALDGSAKIQMHVFVVPMEADL